MIVIRLSIFNKKMLLLNFSHIKFSLQAAKSLLTMSHTVSKVAALCIKFCNTHLHLIYPRSQSKF